MCKGEKLCFPVCKPLFHETQSCVLSFVTIFVNRNVLTFIFILFYALRLSFFCVRRLGAYLCDMKKKMADHCCLFKEKNNFVGVKYGRFPNRPDGEQLKKIR